MASPFHIGKSGGAQLPGFDDSGPDLGGDRDGWRGGNQASKGLFSRPHISSV